MKTQPSKVATWLILADIHYPAYHKPTFRAALDFARHNKISGIVTLGDQFDNGAISHHNAGRPLLKPAGQFSRDTEGFDRDVLKPLEALLPKDAARVWVIGNHDGWEDELVEQQPELKGAVERPLLLDLENRGWTVIPEGGTYRQGRLSFTHGEHFGTQYYSRRAVDLFCGNVVFGHHHSLQTYTRVLARDPSQKWTATCLPIVGSCNAAYLKSRPTNWVNGFGIVEYYGSGFFNLFPVVTTGGRCAYGGRVYGGKARG